MNLDNSVSGTSAKLTIPLNLTIASKATGYVIYVKSADATGQSYFSGTNTQLTESSNSIIINAGTQVFNNIQFVAGSTCARTPVDVVVTTCNGGVPTINYTNVTKTYGNPSFDFVATSNSTGAITYSIASGTAASITSSGTVTILGAGMVSVKINQAAAGAYVATSAIANIVINKANLTITADNKTRAYNVANPTLTMTYSGFVNSETKTVITQPSISTTAVLLSNVGNYPITLTGGTANNYNLILVNGTLQITAASLVFSITSANTGKVGGIINLTISSPSTGAVTYSVVNGTGKATVAGNVLTLVSAGTVTLTANQVANGNYAAGSKSMTVTISIVTGIENTEIIEFNLYPNPVKDVLFIQHAGIQSLKVVDLSGQAIHVSNSINHDLAELKTDLLPNGYYILKIETLNGIQVKKFFVSK